MGKTCFWVLGLTVLNVTMAAAYPLAPDRAAQLRVGAFFPRGGGELWDSNEEVFTLDVSDFNDWSLGFSYVHGLNNHAEVGLNVDFYEGGTVSEYRGIDHPGSPVVHDTRLRLLPFTVDLRLLPAGRYRLGGKQGRQAFRKPAIYVGAGLGANYWEYEELGEFLDCRPDCSEDSEIFFDRFVESGLAFEAHVLGGLELPMTPFTNLLFEGRYSFSDDEPEGDFAGLGQLHLGGASAYAGLSFRF